MRTRLDVSVTSLPRLSEPLCAGALRRCWATWCRVVSEQVQPLVGASDAVGGGSARDYDRRMTDVSLFFQRLLGNAAPVAAAVAAEYTVDELAQAAQTTVRNVRAYQDRGLLSPPERRGRVGVYNGEHLARLRLVGQLLERGYSIASIRELFDAWAQGRDLAHVLGLDQAIRAPVSPSSRGAWSSPSCRRSSLTIWRRR